MKNLCFFSIIPLIAIPSLIKSQTPQYQKIVDKEIFKDLTSKVDTIRSKEKILSEQAFNKIVGKTISTYLSNSNDLNFNKAFALLDNTDDKLYVGGNIPLRSKISGRLYSFISLGAKTNISDKVSEIFNKVELSNDVSVETKITFPLFYSIKFDGNKYQRIKKPKNKIFETSQKNSMDLQRTKIIQDKKAKAIKELKNLCESLTGISNNENKDEAIKDSIKIVEEKIRQIKEDLENGFYDDEASAFNESKNKFSNSYKSMWFSITGSFPISETKYSISENFKTYPHDVFYYPISCSARITWVHDYYKYIKYFVNISYIAGKSNTILDNSIKQSSLNKITKIDSVSSVTNSTKVYYSIFNQYFSDNLKGQIILYPKPNKNTYIGVDIFSNFELSTGDASWGAGIPISVKGKDDKSPINFEIIVNKINQPKRITLGISLLLPFSSLIY